MSSYLNGLLAQNEKGEWVLKALGIYSEPGSSLTCAGAQIYVTFFPLHVSYAEALETTKPLLELLKKRLGPSVVIP